MSAYLAVGRVAPLAGAARRRRSSAGTGPRSAAGLDWVVSLQLPFGGIAWSQEWAEDRPGRVNEDALLAGSSSIYQSLRAGCALAELLDEPQPEWELAGGRLGHALREHRDLFLDKSEFSMDWYYPVLGGAVRGEAAHALIGRRWDDFVEPGPRHPLRRHQPVGDRCRDLRAGAGAGRGRGTATRALRLFADMQHLRHDDGGYWTGYVFPDEAVWPEERTTWTAAAVLLAVGRAAGAAPRARTSCAARRCRLRGAGLPRGRASGAAASSADRVPGVPARTP